MCYFGPTLQNWELDYSDLQKLTPLAYSHFGTLQAQTLMYFKILCDGPTQHSKT